MATPPYEEVPRWKVKTFLLRTDDPLAGAVARDEVLNSFMNLKEVMQVNSQVILEKDGFLLFVDTVQYVD